MRRVRATAAETTCVVCGAAYQRKTRECLTCSNGCRQALIKRNIGIQRQSRCRHCGKDYTPKTAYRTTFCSRECSFRFMAVAKAVEAMLPRNNLPDKQRDCSWCGKRFWTSTSSKACSAACQEAHQQRCNREQARKYYARNLRRAARALCCAECGKQMKSARHNARYCSPQCANRVAKRNAHARHRRKIDGRGKVVLRRALIDRDGHRCGICGKRINLSLPRHHPMAWSIDHIVPLAKGGAHEPSNCQLAHRQCNSLKRDQLVGCQPALW